MRTDTLARRLRSAPPNSKVGRLVLTEADYLIFEAIDRHGPLPTHYLFEFVRHLRRDYTHFQHRLTEFYNGDSRGPYLTRPRQQFAAFEARYQHLVYDLAPRARMALAERGTLARHSRRCADPFVHQLMGACVGASLELGARRKGLRYISREEIFAHPKCPDSTKRAGNPLAIPLVADGTSSLVPDDLFGLEYSGAGFRFFAVEIDRNTESIERRNPGQSGFGRKVDAYLAILRSHRYREHWGIPNLTILTATTNANHELNLVEYVRRHAERDDAGRFAFVSEPAFSANWHVPRSVFDQLVDRPWATPNGSKQIGRP